MKKNAAVLMIIALICMAMLPGCSGNQVAKDLLAVNVGPDPDTIDPALNSSVDGATMIIHVFEGPDDSG